MADPKFTSPYLRYLELVVSVPVDLSMKDLQATNIVPGLVTVPMSKLKNPISRRSRVSLLCGDGGASATGEGRRAGCCPAGGRTPAHS